MTREDIRKHFPEATEDQIKPCPSCNHQLEPCYDNTHQPFFWHECPACGYILDMRSYEAEETCALEGGESDDE